MNANQFEVRTIGKAMEISVVAVGSTRMPKVQAVRQALETFGAVLDPNGQFHVIGVDVPSVVSHTPRSRSELMAGARGRAEALMSLALERGERWRYFVGLEGGLDVVREELIKEKGVQKNDRRWVFLESWAFVSDGAGREAFGQAGGVILPEPLAEEVLDCGTELSSAIDAYAGGHGIRDAQGAWGVLTRNIITRQEAFRIAVIHAFAPFFNAPVYR
jgi:inosine/xanthosine triphosphatase